MKHIIFCSKQISILVHAAFIFSFLMYEISVSPLNQTKMFTKETQLHYKVVELKHGLERKRISRSLYNNFKGSFGHLSFKQRFSHFNTIVKYPLAYLQSNKYVHFEVSCYFILNHKMQIKLIVLGQWKLCFELKRICVLIHSYYVQLLFSYEKIRDERGDNIEILT